MLLEAGLKKDNNANDKAMRRSWSTGMMGNNNTYVNYERWLKYIALTSFSVWIVFVLLYWNDVASPSFTASVVNGESKKVVRGQARGSIVTSENAFPEETNFIVIGDYGTGDDSQMIVGNALKLYAATLDPQPAFVVSTGDQIYEHGILSSTDPKLSERFEQVYDHPGLQVPWYITIGNHDCEGSIAAMLEYAEHKNSLWYMPRRYYSIDRPVAPKTILRMIVIDACDLVCGHEPRNFRCKDPMNAQSSHETRLEQYRWIERELSAPKPAGVERMWTIVVGHWAIYSYAGNADTAELIQMLDPLLQKYRVHAYFNGHDHCMQHIKKREDGWDRHYFVSGAGGYRVHELQSKARENADLVHAAMTNGFMSVRVARTLFRVQFVDRTGEILYTTEVDYE